MSTQDKLAMAVDTLRPEVRKELRYLKLLSTCSNAPPLMETVEILTHELLRLAALEGRQQWRPIETAPKDGTYILVCGSQTYLGEEHWASTSQWVALGDTPGAGYFNADNQLAMGMPTHWMPIPEPPK